MTVFFCRCRQWHCSVNGAQSCVWGSMTGRINLQYCLLKAYWLNTGVWKIIWIMELKELIFLIRRNDTIISMQGCLLYSSMYICSALLFYILLYTWTVKFLWIPISETKTYDLCLECYFNLPTQLTKAVFTTNFEMYNINIYIQTKIYKCLCKLKMSMNNLCRGHVAL